MSLTGPVFLGAVVVVTVVAFVALLVWWPRLAPGTPGHVAGRALSLASVNLLVLLTAATQLNAANLFFANWADLTGALTGQQARTAMHRGASVQQALSRPVPGGAGRTTGRALPLTRHAGLSGMLAFRVRGARSGLTGTVVVELPQGYTPTRAARYPVLEAFQGYPSSPLTWLTKYDLQRDVGRLVAAHRLRQPLIVAPEVEFPAGVDTEGVDGTSGRPQVETWLTRDVPQWVSRHFRVTGDRDGWATLGDSAGGWTAAMATLLHPAQYGAGIVLGGYFKPTFGPFPTPFRPGSPRARRYDLAGMVARHAPPVALWVETSRADRISYPSTSRFLATVRPPVAVHAVILQNAGHRSSVFEAMVPQALRWLGAKIPGFRP